jgi:opacity protein-like surface antigen
MIPFETMFQLLTIACSAIEQPIPPTPAAEEAGASSGYAIDAEISTLQDRDGSGGYDGWHLQFGAGLTTYEDVDGPDEEIDFDEGMELTAGIIRRTGADDGNNWAFDWGFEAIWTDQDADSDDEGPVRDVTVLGGLITGVAEYAFTPAFAGFFGLGIGVAWVDVGTRSDNLSDFEEEDGPFLAWDATAGVRWWTSENVAWHLGYRFLNVSEVEVEEEFLNQDNFDLDTEQHIAELGIRFHL